MIDDRTRETKVVRDARRARVREYGIDLIVTFGLGVAVGALAVVVYLAVRV